jgi:hypothetical protein
MRCRVLAVSGKFIRARRPCSSDSEEASDTYRSDASWSGGCMSSGESIVEDQLGHGGTISVYSIRSARRILGSKVMFVRIILGLDRRTVL